MISVSARNQFAFSSSRSLVSGRRWFFAVTIGEAIGFLVPGVAWGIAWGLGLPPIATYVLVVSAGAGEGAVLGLSQSRVLEACLPGISRSWISRTAVAASFAWAIGLAPSTLADLGSPAWLSISIAACGALPLLASIGVAQWTVLRHRVPRATQWIGFNAGAWLAGLPVTFIAPALVPEGSPWYAWTIAFVVAGACMAATVAAITGAAMRRLLNAG